METQVLLHLAALLAGAGLAALTAPVGVSGAVLLMPFHQVVLQVPGVRASATTLLFNVVAAPGGVFRALGRQFDLRLTALLVTGSVPGVLLGVLARVHLVDSPARFHVLAAAVLTALGLLTLFKAHHVGDRDLPALAVVGLAVAVGVVGGAYGIGGGAVVAPLLTAAGMSLRRVAPAALTSTWVTSVVGVVAYQWADLAGAGATAPDWSFGLCAGLGGLIGGFWGVRLAAHLPEERLRRTLGIVCLLLAATYLARVL